MTESTARAERLDLPSSGGAYYIWQVPQKPVAVRLPLALIDRLEQQTVESFRSLTSRGSEIGGLLLGGIGPGNPATVSVEDFELIQCDYSRGPLYRLSDADMSRFERAIEQHGSGAGLRVAGFFRSHTRKGLSLDAEDVAFFEPRFHDPNHIVLLVRPFATKASAAGIFIRENGRISGDVSLMEFPFRSSELGGGARRLGMDAAPSAPPQSQAAAEPPAANKAPARAQIVPIASRREMPAQEQGVKPAQPNPPAPPPVAAKAPAPQAPPPPPVARIAPASTPPAPPAARVSPATPPAPPAARVSPTPPPAPRVTPAPPPPAAKSTPPAPKVAPAPQTPPAKVTPAPAAPAAKIAPAAPAAKAAPAEPPKKKEEEKAKEVAPAAPAPKVPQAAAIASAVAPPAANKNKKVRLLVAAALGMLVLVGGFLFVYPALLHRGDRSQTVAQQDSSPLGLHIERTAGGLLLTWNNHSPAIQHASKVVLSITDGERHENIAMDPNQVRTGSIVYPPLSGDVSFQMEVADANQSRTTSESLRVHDPRPSPLATSSTPATQGPQPGPKQNTPGKSPNAESPDATSPESTPKPPDEQAVVRNPTPVKQFDKESLGQRLRPAAPADMAEAPAEVRANAAAPGNFGSIMSGAASAPAAPARPAPSRPADTSAAAANAGSGGQIIPAEPTYKKAPEYPKVARQIGASGVVEIEAMIGTDGRVRNAKVTKGNPMLQKAAIDAVMEWKYKPALLNGKPVESPVQIKLNFTPDR
jgi:TonB family protein